jgi:hypothetical protein
LARQDPAATQQRTLAGLLRQARGTVFGQAHGFATIRTVEDYQLRTRLRSFEAFWDEYWKNAFPQVGGITWPGRIPFFAKTSGTAGAASKYIPVSPAIMRSNQGAARDVLAAHLGACPGSRIMAGKTLMLGGSTALEALAPGIFGGDLSGIAASTIPRWARKRVLPPAELALLPDWREKMQRIAKLSLGQTITGISGTASWLLLFFDIVSSLRGGARLAELYPDLELVVHGGVGFAPYRERFGHWLQGSAARTREVFAASEGFCGYADRGDGEGMRLVLDRGLFFEFVRPGDLESQNPDRRWIENAELGVEYALVLSTNAGLWAYLIGDTIRLVTKNPPRLLVTGRTAWSLSVAGEHLISAELDAAVTEAAQAVGRRPVEYSVAPVPPDAADPRGGHFFAVELDGPADPQKFAEALDAALLRQNEDYAAHRSGGFGMRDPAVRLLPPAAFARWMERRGKLGGQNKVPRVVSGVASLAGLLDDV